MSLVYGMFAVSSICHPEGPEQAGEVGPCEPHEVQQGQVQSPARGSGQPPLGDEGLEGSPEEEDLGVLVDDRLGHEPPMWARSPEGQLYPGLHQENCGQQIEGGDSAPLLRSGETPPGVLHPALEPSAQERHGAVGAGPEEGHEDDLRAGTPLL